MDDCLCKNAPFTNTKKPIYTIAIANTAWNLEWDWVLALGVNIKEVCIVVRQAEEVMSGELVFTTPSTLPQQTALREISRYDSDYVRDFMAESGGSRKQPHT